MIDAKQLRKINEVLGAKLGRLDDGTPAFRFMRTGELTFPVKTGTETVITEGGLYVTKPVYERKLQMPGQEDTWCLARWVKPPMRDIWERDYPSLEYPTNGYWFCVVPLRPGKEPTEDWAHFAADQMNWQRELTYSQTLELITAHRKRQEDADEAEIAASVRDSWVNHVPGVRGGSYSVFSEPASKLLN